MTATRREVMAACETLACVAQDIERRLATDPAWLALRQLDERIEAGRPVSAVDQAVLRARLLARVDADVPGWRLLDAVKDAIAVLDAGLRGESDPRPVNTSSHAIPAAIASPPPLSGSPRPRLASWPKEPADAPREDVATILRRIRMVEPAVQAGTERPDPPTQRPALTIAEPARASSPAFVPAAPVEPASPAVQRAWRPEPLAASPARERDDVRSVEPSTEVARMLALETEVEKLVTGDRSRLSTSFPAASGAWPVDPYLLHGLDEESVGPVEEAVVEIVVLPEVTQRTSEAATARLDDVDAIAAGPSVSLQAYLDEASVEIVMIDNGTDTSGTKAAPT